MADPGSAFTSAFLGAQDLKMRRKQMETDRVRYETEQKDKKERDALDRELRLKLINQDAEQFTAGQAGAKERLQMQLDAQRRGASEAERARLQTDFDKMVGGGQPGGTTMGASGADMARWGQVFSKSGPSAGGASLAQVEQRPAGTTVKYQAPVAEAKQLAANAAYKNPYSGQLADIDSQIAGHEAEIAGGDTRTGFLGIGTSRQGEIEKLKRQRLALRGMELQDQLKAGLISPEEADQRANSYLQQ